MLIIWDALRPCVSQSDTTSFAYPRHSFFPARFKLFLHSHTQRPKNIYPQCWQSALGRGQVVGRSTGASKALDGFWLVSWWWGAHWWLVVEKPHGKTKKNVPNHQPDGHWVVTSCSSPICSVIRFIRKFPNRIGVGRVMRMTPFSARIQQIWQVPSDKLT